MEYWRKRIVLVLLGLAVIVVGYSVVYRWAMVTFEGIEPTFTHSMRIVIESLTTAGFGGDTDYWTTTELDLLVMAMNLTGVLLVFLAIPLFAVPMFREAFYTKPPESSSLTDHVIICGYSFRDEVLCGELDAAGVPYLYVETDTEVVRSLIDRGIPAMVGDSERIETLQKANIGEASAVVADINDETNPTVILSAKRANPNIPVISAARRSDAAEYHRYAGADVVIEAPRALGESLGLRAATSFAEKFRASLENGSEIQVTEILIEEGSALIGQTLRDTDAFDGKNLQVFGGWFGGRFLIPPDPDVEIVENTILLIAGDYDLAGLSTRQLPQHLDDRSRILLCGYGAVGHAAARQIESHGNECNIIDVDPSVEPDIVGDATDPTTFLNQDVQSYRSVILALDQDTTTIYSTLILNQLAPNVDIIARVHNPDNVWKLYSAGADFVLSMSVITGELLAAELLDDVEILTAHDEFEFERVDAKGLAGQSLAEANIRSVTEATVVAIERSGEIITGIGPDFRFESDDTVVIAGRPVAIEAFISRFS